MGKKHKKMVYFIVIRKMPIRTAVRYHFKLIRLAKFESGNTKCWHSYIPIITIICCWRKYKSVQPFWRTVWQHVVKLRVCQLHCQGVPFLGLSPRETLTCMHRETCIRMFFATLFVIRIN